MTTCCHCRGLDPRAAADIAELLTRLAAHGWPDEPAAGEELAEECWRQAVKVLATLVVAP